MKPILLTGFEPFGGDPINPSEQVALELNGAVVARRRVVGAVLPCVFGAALRELLLHIRTHEPALVVCLGLAGGRRAVSAEQVALNLDDARIPDNAGRRPVNRAVIRGGPAAYWSRLPVRAIVRELGRRGVPAELSLSAGTFVCNHVFYGLMHEIALHRPRMRGGFVHLPYLPGQGPAGAPSLPRDTMVEAVRTALAVAAG